MSRKRFLTVREMAVFAMLGSILFVSKLVFEALPNIHPVGMLVVVYTLVYRKKALVPIYLFVFLFGMYYGFTVWWLPYLYVWTALWGGIMLLPRNMKPPVAYVVYASVCFLHGLLFSFMGAPFWVLAAGLPLKSVWVWLADGFGFDILHALGNLAASILVLPLVKVIRKIERAI